MMTDTTVTNGLKEESAVSTADRAPSAKAKADEATAEEVDRALIAAEALRDAIWNGLQQCAEKELDALTLQLKSDELEWIFDFEYGGFEDDKLRIILAVTDPTDGRGTYRMPLHLDVQLRSDGEPGKRWIEIGVGMASDGRTRKHFDFLVVTESDKRFHVEPEETTPHYQNRNVNETIKEVWFPAESETESAAVEIPLELRFRTTESPDEFVDHAPTDWPMLSDGALRIKLPSFEIQEQTSGEEEGDHLLIDVDERDCFFASISFVAFWIISNVYGGVQASLRDKKWAEGPHNEKTVEEVFPDTEDYEPTRPIDLNPASIIDDLEDEDFFFPWHVVESACAALNAGKHVIFTGPPGCGKSKLSSFLAEMATGHSALMATASPAWTSGDLIGRYLPKKGDEHGLVFREGFFLRAIKTGDGVGESSRSRWLIIDEFNRADIDACFGELFSVLAGDLVELPFEKTVEMEREADEETEKVERFVRIIPEDVDSTSDADYRVPRRFRLIGTMNDADRSGLNDLSFALMRRFAIIPVEPPETSMRQKIIRQTIENTSAELKLGNYAWMVGKYTHEQGRSRLSSIADEIERLFANARSSEGLNWQAEKRKRHLRDGGPSEIDETFQDLVAERVVGVSVVQDVVRFVGEGLRAGTLDDGHDPIADWTPVKNGEVSLPTPTTREECAEQLALSYLAMAIVLQVFPQLEALAMGTERGENQLFSAIWHIFWSFHTNFRDDGTIEERDPEDLLMLRVTKTDDGYELRSDQRLSEFLFQNLLTRFPHIGAEEFRSHLSPWLPDDGEWESM